MTDITVADWLAEAGDYLEHNGWWRNSMLGPNRRQACAMGAILFSQGLGECAVSSPAVTRVAFALQQALAPDKVTYPVTDANSMVVNNITYWNDSLAENKQEVLDAFRKAEKIERAGYDPDA